MWFEQYWLNFTSGFSKSRESVKKDLKKDLFNISKGEGAWG
jgi:hypothetical protein